MKTEKNYIALLLAFLLGLSVATSNLKATTHDYGGGYPGAGFGGPGGLNDNLHTGLTLCGKLIGANFNTTADQTITITNWSGAWNDYFVDFMYVKNASVPLTTAAGGIYTGASKTGVVVVAASTAYSGISQVGINNQSNALITGANTRSWLNVTTMFLSLTTAQGSAATADVYLFCRSVPSS